MAVPYDEQRLRRSLKFVLRRNVKRLRVIGLIMAALGAVLMLVTGPTITTILLVVLGLVYAVAMEPLLLWQSLRALNPATRQDYRLTVDEAGITMKADAYEQRLAWSTIQRVDEQPDAWFLMITKAQALGIYKNLMTAEQRSQFVAILAQRQPA
ncbi:YcxB-like protein [Saccharothrix carnea]|uniref:YcxB-like protein n=2 Tax=Saccharothrix carnea TaxID=1280637 RepID=A0A2P8I165_SACCR|nr:YcxB-like protein [Saccharothrix carnea]